MTRTLILGLLALALLATTATAQAQCPGGNCENLVAPVTGVGMTHHDVWAAYMASRTPWHGQYYHTNWNRPVALVVPPIANNHTSWGWGVNGTRVMPIYPQFHRRFPGAAYGGYASGGRLYPTPNWPSDTEQFGVYYVRGPW